VIGHQVWLAVLALIVVMLGLSVLNTAVRMPSSR
jgi:hypothetical protein